MYTVKPIGIVETGLPEDLKVNRYEFVSTIRLFDEYVDGLAGLGEYSHAIILWLMHRVQQTRLRVVPFNRRDVGEVGIFATRFPPRPNPIGLSVVEIVDVDPPRLRVRGLDAWSGSPVIDIKPYDYMDVVKRPRIPTWLAEKLDEASKHFPDWLGPCTC